MHPLAFSQGLWESQPFGRSSWQLLGNQGPLVSILAGSHWGQRALLYLYLNRQVLESRVQISELHVKLPQDFWGGNEGFLHLQSSINMDGLCWAFMSGSSGAHCRSPGF